MVALELEHALEVALQATAVAREMLLAECARPGGPRGEIGHCPADDEAELAIREILERAFPDWGYLGEETGARPSGSGEVCMWIVDPNDGTTSMQRGYRGHAVSIGLVRDGVPVLGVVCAVDAPDDRGDLIAWAEGCGPMLRNGLPIARGPFDDELHPLDIVGVSQAANRNPVGYLASVAPARYVSSPSIAYRLALVAVGEHVATLSLNHLRVWDFAAGHALVRAAGGVVLDDQARPLSYAPETRTRIFAGHAQVIQTLIARHWDGISRTGLGDAAPPADVAPLRARVGTLVHDSGVLSRAQGCVLGQIAGDALGALVEFASAEQIASDYPDGGPRVLADGGPHAISAGQPTDDSELALLLGRRLVVDGAFSQERVAAAYAGWYHGWSHTPDPNACDHMFCKPFDVGGTIGQALRAVRPEDVRSGQAAVRARSAANPRSQANGALMRVSPLAIWGTFRDATTVAAAARQDAQLTHPHPVCQSASAAFCVAIAAAIHEGLSPRETFLRARGFVEGEVRAALDRAEHAPPDDYLSQQGWVLVALQNAFFQLLHAENVETGVVDTVRRGGDTDTNAAICGALLGAVHGRQAIPEQWQAMVLSCRPMPGQPDVHQPRPAIYWPTDALVLAERLLTA